MHDTFYLLVSAVCKNIYSEGGSRLTRVRPECHELEYGEIKTKCMSLI
jgi:hypothetical protein